MILYYRKRCIAARHTILLSFILKLFFLARINTRLERINTLASILYLNNTELCFFPHLQLLQWSRKSIPFRMGMVTSKRTSHPDIRITSPYSSLFMKMAERGPNAHRDSPSEQDRQSILWRNILWFILTLVFGRLYLHVNWLEIPRGLLIM